MAISGSVYSASANSSGKPSRSRALPFPSLLLCLPLPSISRVRRRKEGETLQRQQNGAARNRNKWRRLTKEYAAWRNVFKHARIVQLNTPEQHEP